MTNTRTRFVLSSLLLGLSLSACENFSKKSEAKDPSTDQSQPADKPAPGAARPSKATAPKLTNPLGTKAQAAIPKDALKAVLLVPSPEIPFVKPDNRVRAQMETLGKNDYMHFGKDFPVPQRVDAVLRITNTSTKTLSFFESGDSTFVSVVLKGKNAWSGNAPGYCTEEHREGQTITLAPGAHYDRKVANLSSGDRCDEHWAQADSKGDYELSASFSTWVNLDGNRPLAGIQVRFELGPVPLRFI